MISLDGNNCETHSISTISIHWSCPLDACIYDEDSANRVLYTVQHGHQIGSHTWSHADLTTLSSDQSQYQVLDWRPKFFIYFYAIYNTFVFIAVNSEMARVEGKLHVIFSCLLILIVIFIDLSLVSEALRKIAGIVPAFMRPRMFLTNTIWTHNLVNQNVW